MKCDISEGEERNARKKERRKVPFLVRRFLGLIAQLRVGSLVYLRFGIFGFMKQFFSGDCQPSQGPGFFPPTPC